MNRHDFWSAFRWKRALVRARTELVNQQLQNALNNRIVIEQAKGILAERGCTDVNAAFVLLRSHARSSRQKVSDLARAVVEGADTTEILYSTMFGQPDVELCKRVSSPR